MILAGNRILIKLDPHPQHTTTASGLEIPQFRLEETDGGKMKVRTSNTKYLSKGTVLDISPYAKQRLKDEDTPLNIGDKVFVPTSAVSPNYQFFLTRDAIVLDFDGHIAVPHTLIEAIL